MILGEEAYDSGEITMPRNYTVRHLSQHVDFRSSSVLGEACLSLPAREDGRDETYRAKSILLGLGFSPTEFDKNPRELSGGFQVRLNLARVLVADPNLLLLDEPTNYLDIVSTRWLSQFLKAWRNEMILVTHDRAFMDGVTTHTMGLHRLKIRKMPGSTHKLYDQILEEEEVYEQTRINEEKKRKEAEIFINRFRAQATRARAVQSRIKALGKKSKAKRVQNERSLDFTFKAAPFAGKWLVDVKGLCFSYAQEGPPLIDKLTFAIKKGDRIGFIGKNGKGKTTLLNLLAGELTPLAGVIERHQNVEIDHFGQSNVNRLKPDNTVEEEILGADQTLSRGEVRAICGAMLFDGDKALKKVSVLSGGEKSRVLIGKLLARPANLLLLDEPTNHLDMESVDSLIEAMDAFEGTLVIATHSEMILNAMARRLIVFDGGKVSLYEGSYQDFLDRVGWEDEEESGLKAFNSNRKGEEKEVGRKELRRMKAEFIRDRSRTLVPLQERIHMVETSIIRLEEQMEEDNMALIRATQRGDGRSISSLSVAIHQAKGKIEILFSHLEAVSREHAEKSREFEARLQELTQKTDESL